jgi:hypothetical protein
MADARRELLGRLIDYAGLFPPAQLSMDDAVAGYRAARGSEHAWLLDRFVCPAALLPELAAAAPDDGWPVTVTVDLGDLPEVLGYEGPLALAAVEVRLPQGAGAPDVALIAPLPGLRCFVEVPLGDEAPALLDALASASLAAKVRCGGAAPPPSPEALATFVAECARRDLSWKATAGLHHSVRDTDPQTGAPRHGFLNLLAASGLAAGGSGEDELAEVLADSDRAAFTLDETGLTWRGQTVGAQARARFDGYGSCSFDEPVEDLLAMGVLGAQAAVDA